MAYQYTLSTAWDLSTATYDSKSLDMNTEDNYMSGFDIDSTWTKLISVWASNDKAYKYTLSTAWDISTATYDNESFWVALWWVFWCFLHPDWIKLYTTIATGSDINSYLMSYDYGSVTQYGSSVSVYRHNMR